MVERKPLEPPGLLRFAAVQLSGIPTAFRRLRRLHRPSRRTTAVPKVVQTMTERREQP